MVDMSLRYQSLTGSFLIGYYLAFYLSCSQNSDLKHKGTLCSAFHLLLKSHFYLSVIGYMIGIHPKGTNRRSFFQCFPWKVSNKTKQKLWQKYVFLDFSLEFFFFWNPISYQLHLLPRVPLLPRHFHWYQQSPNTNILNQNIAKKVIDICIFGSIYISACIAALVTDLIQYNETEFTSSTKSSSLDNVHVFH